MKHIVYKIRPAFVSLSFPKALVDEQFLLKEFSGDEFNMCLKLGIITFVLAVVVLINILTVFTPQEIDLLEVSIAKS